MAEINDNTDRPDCFGVLETVFPVDETGLRTSPPECMRCVHAKSCLQTALCGPEGLKLQEERLDHAYERGLIGRLECWSRKKLIRQQIEAIRLNEKKK